MIILCSLRLVPVSSTVDEYSCKTPDFVTDLLYCITQLNFFACPVFKEKEECEATKNMIVSKSDSKCGDKYGHIANLDFWYN